MPLYRGAASKAILAHLPARTIRRLWRFEEASIRAAGLGDSWDAFRTALRGMRKQAAIVTHGDLDQGLVGISSPVFGGGKVVGSIGIVTTATSIASTPSLLARLIEQTHDAALSTSSALNLRTITPEEEKGKN